ncbi:MAG: hypothetical protein L3J16_07665, partial [Anaerolineales bacterium]|nr:hypothetical protein [Anaerolineales bacterium]
VTLDDLMEDIGGEVSDPFDNVQPEIQKQADGSVKINGLALIEDVNKELSLDLQDPNYDTIAGLVLGSFNRIPAVGDSIERNDVRFTVDAMDGMRIERLKLERLK